MPYVDSTGMKADLIAWCGNRSRTTAGRLVHGHGGLGKTRLMIEVAAALRADGWIAGFFDRPHERVDATLKQRWQALEQLITQGDHKGLLIIMDYAEGQCRRLCAGVCIVSCARSLSRRRTMRGCGGCAPHGADGRPAQVVDVTLRRRFVPLAIAQIG